MAVKLTNSFASNLQKRLINNEDKYRENFERSILDDVDPEDDLNMGADELRVELDKEVTQSIQDLYNNKIAQITATLEEKLNTLRAADGGVREIASISELRTFAKENQRLNKVITWMGTAIAMAVPLGLLTVTTRTMSSAGISYQTGMFAALILVAIGLISYNMVKKYAISISP